MPLWRLLAALAVLAHAAVCAPPDLTRLTLQEVHDMTFYQMLGVSETAARSDPEGMVRDLKKAYRKVALQTHPDKFPEEERETAQKRFIAVVSAFETLSDPFKRARYDEMLRRGKHPSGAHEGDGWDDDEFYEYYDFESAYDTFSSADLTEEAAAWGLGVAGVGMLLFVALPVYMTVRDQRRRAENKRRKHVETMKATSQTGKRGATQRSAKEKRREEELLRQRTRARERTEREETLRREAAEGAARSAKAAAKGGGGGGDDAADRRARQARREQEERKAASRPWSPAEMSALAKLVARFPGGTPGRWEVIAKHLNSTLPRHAHRPWKAVAKQAQSLDPSAIPAAAPAAAAAAATSASEDWSAEDQRLFEVALKQFPSGTSGTRKEGGADVQMDRWDMVAGAVPGKTRKQCVRRFKTIRKRMRSNAAAAARE